MKDFEPYVEYLRTLLTESYSDPVVLQSDRVPAALDGEPLSRLRQLVPRSEIRRDGAFFTGQALAQAAVKGVLRSIDSDSVIADPTCGVGDLFLACCGNLPRGRNIDETLRLWGDRIRGRDLHPEFVDAAKSRLHLAAARPFGHRLQPQPSASCHPFPQLRAGCGLDTPGLFRGVTHIVSNPPFFQTTAPDWCDWCNGSVNISAVFVERWVQFADTRTRLLALLPDVLRSGTRYERWRRVIEGSAKLHSLRRLALSNYVAFDQL